MFYAQVQIMYLLPIPIYSVTGGWSLLQLTLCEKGNIFGLQEETRAQKVLIVFRNIKDQNGITSRHCLVTYLVEERRDERAGEGETKVQSCSRPLVLESELLKSAQGGVGIIITVYVCVRSSQSQSNSLRKEKETLMSWIGAKTLLSNYTHTQKERYCILYTLSLTHTEGQHVLFSIDYACIYAQLDLCMSVKTVCVHGGRVCRCSLCWTKSCYLIHESTSL